MSRYIWLLRANPSTNIRVYWIPDSIYWNLDHNRISTPTVPSDLVNIQGLLFTLLNIWFNFFPQYSCYWLECQRYQFRRNSEICWYLLVFISNVVDIYAVLCIKTVGEVQNYEIINITYKNLDNMMIILCYSQLHIFKWIFIIGILLQHREELRTLNNNFGTNFLLKTKITRGLENINRESLIKTRLKFLIDMRVDMNTLCTVSK